MSINLSPTLRIFRKLDVSALSEEFIEKITHEEGRADYVDSEKARDFPWTEEIMQTTIGAALVDEQGNVVAEWTGANAWRKALAARDSAKVTFSLDLDDAGDVESDAEEESE